MKALVVKLSSLGDVIHALPALTDAARAFPQLRFDWVVEEAFAQVPAWHPAVERVIPVALRRWRKRPWKDFSGAEWQAAREQLAREPYTAVIDAQGLVKSALIARLAQGKRCGMARGSARESLAALAYHERVAVPRDMHAVERIRRLFAASLGYTRPLQAGDFGIRHEFESLVSEQQQAREPALWFFHGTAREEKTWPEDHWVQLCVLALAQGYRVLLPWGSEGEQRRAERIAAASDAAPGQVEVLPAMTLREIACALVDSRGAVAVDTGLGHLCAALDVPSVSLYGPTSSALVGTYGKQQQHVLSPLAGEHSAQKRMAAIEPQVVWATLARQWPLAVDNPGGD